MSVLPDAPRKLTWRVNLPGGRARLRGAILYVSKACEAAPFDSFAERGQPVTGRQYQRLPQGPAPIEMRTPLYPVAVVLDLVDPVGAGRRLQGARRDAWWDKTGTHDGGALRWPEERARSRQGNLGRSRPATSALYSAKALVAPVIENDGNF